VVHPLKYRVNDSCMSMVSQKFVFLSISLRFFLPIFFTEGEFVLILNACSICF